MASEAFHRNETTEEYLEDDSLITVSFVKNEYDELFIMEHQDMPLTPWTFTRKDLGLLKKLVRDAERFFDE